MQVSRSAGLQSDINVTPLVDVCLVLLIIFMVVTPMIVAGIPVHLPGMKASDSLGDAQRHLPITVNSDGTLYLDNVAIRGEQLAFELARRHEAHPDRAVVVRGDGEVRYREVVHVLDACRKAGFANVGLVGEKR